MSVALESIREAVRSGEYVVLDTETTGIHPRAEIIQIAIVDAQGEPLLESYVKPTRPIPPDAMAIHGITDAMVADAPTIIELEPDIRRAIQDRAVIVYNAEFDMRLLRQSSAACACNINWREMPRRWLCAMQAYAEYRGEPGRTYGEYRWHKLEAAARNEGIPVERAHSALADCLTTWRLVRRLAETGE